MPPKRLTDRAREARERADARNADASAKWDALVEARGALAEAVIPEGKSLTDTPEFAAAMAAKDVYEASASEAKTADVDLKAVLELMGTEAPSTSPFVSARDRAEDPASQTSFGETFTESDSFKAVAAKIPETPGSKIQIGNTDPVAVATRDQVKATLFTTPATVVAPDQVPGIRALPLLPPLTILDLVTMATTDSTSVKWVREKAFTNAAAETAEGNNTKPESALELEVVSFDVKTIAHWLPATKQSLRDISGVRSLIDSKLLWGLKRRLASQLMTGDGIGSNLKGIFNILGIGSLLETGVTGAAILSDLYDATYTVFDAYGEMPNVGFVSRADYKKLRFLESSSGGYIFGPPTQANPVEVDGVLILPNADLPVGHKIVGQWRELAVWIHEGMSIAMSDSHSDYFVKNLVAILAEFAAAAGPMETVAFCEIHPL